MTTFFLTSLRVLKIRHSLNRVWNIIVKLVRKWQNRFDKGKVLFRKYGVWAVLIAAVSPLPLSQISWLAGMGRMSLVKFSLTICAGLIPRYFGEAIFANQLKNLVIK